MSKIVESIFRMIKTLQDQNVENQNVKKNIESQKMTFEVLIFFDPIGNIRRLKVLDHFLAKNTSDFTYGIRKDQNIKKINYLWRITYVYYQALWGVRLGSIRLG